MIIPVFQGHSEDEVMYTLAHIYLYCIFDVQ